MPRILLVEDDADVQSVLAAFLRHQGHEVVLAENGAEAIKIARKEAGTLDLVITDIVMPEGDGFELIKSLTSLKNPPKIVAMSGGSLNLDQQMLLRIANHLPTAAVLTKPITYKELESVVNSVLKGQPPGS